MSIRYDKTQTRPRSQGSLGDTVPRQSSSYVAITHFFRCKVEHTLALMPPNPVDLKPQRQNDADIDDNARDVHFVEPYSGT